MKLLVCGSRKWTNVDLICYHLEMLMEQGFTHIITGGARGADTIAHELAEEFGLETTVILPEWDRYGKAAGVLRNQKMLELEPDCVIGFMAGESRGTRDMLLRAVKAGIPTEVVYERTSELG